MTTADAQRPAHAFSIAPMMDRTDRHFRWFARQLTRRTLLYTEMVVADTILHHVADGRLERYIGFDPIEHPVAIQLGGDDPRKVAEAARIAAERGYDEINLNVGCPSERVKEGAFGAVLMREPARVAELAAAMRAAVSVPVTIKHRIGVDELDRYEDLANFVSIVSGAGVTRFAVHARKAWLSGLSPAENRTVPPLRYDDVYRLKRELPHLEIVLNGGVAGIDASLAQLAHVDGVMVGRAAYDDPLWLAEIDERVFGEPAAPIGARDPSALVEAMVEYAARTVGDRTTLRAIYRHLLPLYHARPGARRWRRLLSDALARPRVGPAVLRDVLHYVETDVRGRAPAGSLSS